MTSDLAARAAAVVFLTGLFVWFAIAVLALVAIERGLMWLARRVTGRRPVPAPAEEARRG